MAYYDNSSFLGVTLDGAFGPELDCSQLSEKTRVAVLETDGKTFLETDLKAVLEKDGKPVCGADDLETICERKPETAVGRDCEY